MYSHVRLCRLSAVALCLVAAVLCVGLGGCKSDQEKAPASPPAQPSPAQWVPEAQPPITPTTQAEPAVPPKPSPPTPGVPQTRPETPQTQPSTGPAATAPAATQPEVPSGAEDNAFRARSLYRQGFVLAGQGKKDEADALFAKALELDPKYAEALWARGMICADKKQLDQAIRFYKEAIKIKPMFAEAHLSLGLAMARQGKLDAATLEFSTATQLKPDYAEAHYYLGQAYADQNDTNRAAAAYMQAVHLAPTHVPARLALARTLAQQGKPAEAVVHYRQVIQQDPKNGLVHGELALAHSTLGELEAAVQEFEQALAISKDDAATVNNYAWFLATKSDAKVRNGARAVELSRRACEIIKDDPSNMDTLAAAYAEAGQFDQAVATATRAAELADKAKATGLATEIRSRLKLYQAGQPYRQIEAAPATTPSAPPPAGAPGPSAG